MHEGRVPEHHEKCLKDLITTLLWKHTEASGKYDGCPYWSTKALASRGKHGKVVTSKREDRYGALRHEHLFPRNQMIEELFSIAAPNMKDVEEKLKHNIGVVVTVEEDEKLEKEGMFSDPWKRYRDAGIEWKEMTN